jgi:hypothetical protein
MSSYYLENGSPGDFDIAILSAADFKSAGYTFPHEAICYL